VNSEGDYLSDHEAGAGTIIRACISDPLQASW
jgi:hypothetical protein